MKRLPKPADPRPFPIEMGRGHKPRPSFLSWAADKSGINHCTQQIWTSARPVVWRALPLPFFRFAILGLSHRAVVSENAPSWDPFFRRYSEGQHCLAIHPLACGAGSLFC